MGRTGRRWLAGVLGLSLAVLLLPFGSTAGAVSPLPITCTAGGTLETTSGPTLTHWKLVGAGSCQGDLDGTYILGNLLVQGTSDTLGLCGDDGVVTNLSLAASGTLVNLSNPLKSKTLSGQTWGAPVTSFPVSTPFTISDASGVIGGGTVNSHIFAKCPGSGGTPAMTVQFTFTS